MNKLFLIVFVVLLPSLVLGQKKYPQEILPGQQKLVTAAQDTLWVLKHSQLQRALIFAKENKLLKEEILVLKQKVGTKSNLNSECDSLVSLHQKDAIFYKEKWLESDKDMDKVVRKYKQQKLMKNIFLGGMFASFVLGAYLFR